MNRLPLLALLPPVLFLAIAAVFLVGMFRDDPDALPSTLVGQIAPEVQLEAFHGGSFSSEDLRQPGVKLVNFWASWCAPCRVEHPQLMALANEGMPIFGINYKDDAAKGQRFLQDLGDPYAAIGADSRGRNAIEWGVYGVPETFVIDGQGKVVLRFAGPITAEILERRIRPAIASAAE